MSSSSEPQTISWHDLALEIRQQIIRDYLVPYSVIPDREDLELARVAKPFTRLMSISHSLTEEALPLLNGLHEHLRDQKLGAKADVDKAQNAMNELKASGKTFHAPLSSFSSWSERVKDVNDWIATRNKAEFQVNLIETIRAAVGMAIVRAENRVSLRGLASS